MPSGIAGTDGFGPPKFTLGSLQAMWESNQSLQAQLVLGSLVGACRATPKAKSSKGVMVDLTAACSVLAGYDKTGNLDASGGWLFSEWSAYAPSKGLLVRLLHPDPATHDALAAQYRQSGDPHRIGRCGGEPAAPTTYRSMRHTVTCST